MTNKSGLSIENAGTMQQSSLMGNEKKGSQPQTALKNKFHNMKIGFKLMLLVSENEKFFEKEGDQSIDDIFEDKQKCFDSSLFKFFGFKSFYGEKSEPFKVIKDFNDNYKKIDGCLKNEDFVQMEIKSENYQNDTDFNNLHESFFSKTFERHLVDNTKKNVKPL